MPKKFILINIVKINLRSNYDPDKFIFIESIETLHILEAEIEVSNKGIHEYCNRTNVHICVIKRSKILKISQLIKSDYYWKIGLLKMKLVVSFRSIICHITW